MDQTHYCANDTDLINRSEAPLSDLIIIGEVGGGFHNFSEVK